MTSAYGLPLLSGPPPSVEPTDSCRKCNKEFSLLFSRSRKCSHCGYSYCHSCSDFQALMPRSGPDNGYDPMNVCAYCIEHLQVTASGIGQLRAMSPSKLKAYADAYNIDISRAVEKNDIIEAILRVRQPNGCLPRKNEAHYRMYKVPNPHAGSRPRGIFSRTHTGGNPPPPPPPRQPLHAPQFPRPDLHPDHPPPPPPRPHPPYSTQPPPPRAQYQPPPFHGAPPPPPNPSTRFRSFPHTYTYSPDPPDIHNPHHHYNAPPYHQSFYPPNHQSHSYPPPPPPHDTRPPPPPPRPSSSYNQRPSDQTYASPPPPTPPRQHTTSAPPHQQSQSQPSSTVPPVPPPSAPLPTLDQLLLMTQTTVAALPISVLKNILFTNHVNASMILEKSELVKKVITLIEDEKRDRERQRMAEEAERIEEEERRREREEAIQREQEEKRRREQEERDRRDGRTWMRATVEEVDDEEDSDVEMGSVYDLVEEEEVTVKTQEEPKLNEEKGSPPAKPSVYNAFDRPGLCVICQDEEANIAIVDCGHMVMCRPCSDLVMKGTRECPICRTRIVTEARLLRIFKS